MQTRILLLATGLRDELPEIEGLRQYYGKSVHSCPYCDGWESRGQPITVLGNDTAAAEFAIELRLWSADLILCSNGPLECEYKLKAKLKKNGIAIVESAIVNVKGKGDSFTGIRFADGSLLPRSVLFVSPVQHQRSDLAESLGCSFGEEDGCIKWDDDTSTCVPGVYAAGNASRGSQLVIAAANEGTFPDRIVDLAVVSGARGSWGRRK